MRLGTYKKIKIRSDADAWVMLKFSDLDLKSADRMPGNREKGKYWKSRKGEGFKGTPPWKISNQQQRNFIHEMEQVQNDAQSERDIWGKISKKLKNN